jgi:hypothetical protein
MQNHEVAKPWVDVDFWNYDKYERVPDVFELTSVLKLRH